MAQAARLDERVQGTVEVGASAFRDQLSAEEAELVRSLVAMAGEYMQQIADHTLVSGVGGVLRKPSSARDVDIAVVGLKYAPIEGHNFNDVLKFTTIVGRFFLDRVVPYLKKQGFIGEDLVAEFDGVLRPGSGPLALYKYGFDGEHGGDTVEARADLESFGQYNSKGLQVCIGGLSTPRPIDMQFSFNRTTEEWREEQLQNRLPYAVLFDSERMVH